MNIKKVLLVVCLLAVIAGSWMIVLKKVSGTEEIEKQEMLVQEADSYLERELYVRAIPLYQEALAYDVGKNEQIEQKLLGAYRSYEEMPSYAELVRSRIRRGTAGEEECLEAAGYYLEHGYLEDAMALLKFALENMESQALEDYYEENRYTYQIHATPWVEITPTQTNERMPAYDGKAWRYIDETGGISLEGGYEQAVPFNSDGYAVVRIDGQYFTITENGDWYGRDLTGVSDVFAVSGNRVLAQADGTYGYYDYDFECLSQGHQYDEITCNACGVAAVKKDGKWGIITDEGKTAVDFIYEDVAVNSLGCAFVDNAAMVKKDGAWILIDTEGGQLTQNSFADAKAPESDGYIAVADENGKWGFIDRNGELVIPYQYKDAFSFSNQLAAVRIVDTWGYISRRGELVIDEPLQDAQPFRNGRAQATLADYEAILELDYYEE